MDNRETDLYINKERIYEYIDDFIGMDRFNLQDEKTIRDFANSKFYNKNSIINSLNENLKKIDYQIARFKLEEDIDFYKAIEIDKLNQELKNNLIQLKKNIRFIKENKSVLKDKDKPIIKMIIHKQIDIIKNKITLINIYLDLPPVYIEKLNSLISNSNKPNYRINISNFIKNSPITKDELKNVITYRIY